MARVLHVVEDLSRANTGITAMVEQLAGWQARQELQVGVYSTGKPEVDVPSNVELFWNDDFRFPVSWRCPAHFAEKLNSIILQHGFQLVHLHGLWRAAPWIAQRVAARLGLPSVLTVHGQMQRMAWHGQGQIKAWKKSMYWHLVGKRVFKSVSLVHAITPLEMQHLAPLFPAHDIIVIPNAVDMSNLILQSTRGSKPERNFLFLGRIHPIKRIDWLIESFAEASLPKEWKLIIAGPEDDATHAKKLRALASELGMSERVRFVGAVYREEKVNLLRSAWALVIPSISEVVGMVNLEAAASNTPSITTRETGLLDWEESGGVIISGLDRPALARVLRETAGWSVEERLNRGEKSREFVTERYSLERVGAQWLEIYHQLESGK